MDASTMVLALVLMAFSSNIACWEMAAPYESPGRDAGSTGRSDEGRLCETPGWDDDGDGPDAGAVVADIGGKGRWFAGFCAGPIINVPRKVTFWAWAAADWETGASAALSSFSVPPAPVKPGGADA